MSTGERFLQTKCTVNTRMPLPERLLPLQGTSVRALSEAPAPRSAFLQRRHPIESTYNASLRSAVRSAADVPTRVKDPSSVVDLDASGTLHNGTATASSATATVGSFSLLPASTQRAEYNAGSPTVPLEQLGFYSFVRKQERQDEAAHAASAGQRSASKGGQRTVEVLHKRATYEAFRPPQQDLSLLRSTMLEKSASSRGGSSDLGHGAILEDKVRNYRQPLQSTYQTEYRKAQEQFPTDLDGSFQTQRSVLSDYSSAKDLFRGTPKSLPEVTLPNFMGHVPHHDRNRSRILGDGVEMLRPYSKCTINLASSKGASMVSKSSHAIRDDVSIASTVMGFYTLQAVSAAPVEKAMNKRILR